MRTTLLLSDQLLTYITKSSGQRDIHIVSLPVFMMVSSAPCCVLLQVGKKAMEPAQCAQHAQPQPQPPQPRAQPPRQPGAPGGAQSLGKAKEQTRPQAGAHIQPPPNPQATSESQWQLTALPGKLPATHAAPMHLV